MVFVFAAALALTLVASFAASGRLFLYRRDQKWRREQGAWFGDWPISHTWDNIWRQADYTPEGHRLIPLVIALNTLGVILFVVTFVLFARAD